MEAFLPLRKVGTLRALVAVGNPCADKFGDEYEAFVLAYLGVRWLDYRVIDNEKMAACKEQFQNELEALASLDSLRKREALQDEKDALESEELRKIFVYEAVIL